MAHLDDLAEPCRRVLRIAADATAGPGEARGVTEAAEDVGARAGSPADRRFRRGHGRLQLAIAAGGTVGALARAGLAEALPWDGRGWPWTTFLVNVAGTVLLGWFATRLQERLPPSTYRRPLLGTGFCGALTTFSTFQVELIRLERTGATGTAVAYAAASLALGLVAVYLATALTRRVRLR